MDTTIKIPTELQGAGIPAVLQDELPTLRQGGRIGLFTAIWSFMKKIVLMNLKTRNMSNSKLVRDKIPEIIKKRGESCFFHTAGMEEYKKALLQKLVEEAEEVCNAKSKKSMAKELADVLEVYDALLTAYGLSHDEILVIKKQKKTARGGFEEKVILDIW